MPARYATARRQVLPAAAPWGDHAGRGRLAPGLRPCYLCAMDNRRTPALSIIRAIE